MSPRRGTEHPTRDGDVSRETLESPAARLTRVATAHGVELSPAGAGRLIAVLDRMALEPQNLTAVDGLLLGVDRHLADSLVGVSVPEVADAARICDIGSGGGFPGLVVAQLCPESAVTLVESERGKAAWLSRASAGSPNVRVVHDRSEHLAARERESFDAVIARAVGPVPVVLELAAPLTRVGGSAILWRARPDASEDEQGRRAAQILGFRHTRRVDVHPFAGSERCIDVWSKYDLCPGKFPRRPGMAAKRPL